jgi:phosphoribosyl-AMP cyclohydrolase
MAKGLFTDRAFDHLMSEVELAFDGGLLPALAQDADSGRVLMLAYVTPEAVSRTEETGLAHYYSRSRDELWKKGNTSGHVQHVEEIRVDCDGDALLYLVRQEGGACHTGYESCFYRSVDSLSVPDSADAAAPVDESISVIADTTDIDEQVFDPETVYE